MARLKSYTQRQTTHKLSARYVNAYGKMEQNQNEKKKIKQADMLGD